MAFTVCPQKSDTLTTGADKSRSLLSAYIFSVHTVRARAEAGVSGYPIWCMYRHLLIPFDWGPGNCAVDLM